MKEIKPCPMCGSTNTIISEHSFYCAGCGYELKSSFKRVKEGEG